MFPSQNDVVLDIMMTPTHHDTTNIMMLQHQDAQINIMLLFLHHFAVLHNDAFASWCHPHHDAFLASWCVTCIVMSMHHDVPQHHDDFFTSCYCLNIILFKCIVMFHTTWCCNIMLQFLHHDACCSSRCTSISMQTASFCNFTFWCYFGYHDVCLSWCVLHPDDDWHHFVTVSW